MPFDPFKKLQQLLELGRETEWLECKTAKNNFDFDDLGKYFSALSNEANLFRMDSGWLLLGVDNGGTITGTSYRMDRPSLDSLKHEVARRTSNGITFVQIHEVQHSEGRVIMFEIPAALQGLPTSWKGHYYGRDGDSLVPLNPQEYEAIRGQALSSDWSAELCERAVLSDLDPKAIRKARENFSEKRPHLADEIFGWDDPTFLNKARITIDGSVTRAAVLLLGREESVHLLSPAPGLITWILKDASNIEKDYEHFGPPWVLRVEEIWSRIRNLRYRHMPGGTLFPLEITQYDDWVFREALHNCIAHQDYLSAHRIVVVEFPDRLVLDNAGTFIPQSVEAVIERDAPESRYRNPFLAGAMMNLNMIDTIGSGIKRMFMRQRDRLFPMPDYAIEPNRVSVKVLGHVLDPNYVQHLASQTSLSLHEVMLLDKVQKGARITKDEAKQLKRRHLVEGRYPKLYVGAKMAAMSKQKARYLHNRGLDEEHYAELIVEHIRRFGAITRPEADELLFSKLPNILNEKQKKNKVHRILSVVLKGKIQNTGSRVKSRYVLFDSECAELDPNQT